MTYEVQIWDEENHCVNYHTVVDANSFEEAQRVIQSQYPDQKVLCVTKRRDP